MPDQNGNLLPGEAGYIATENETTHVQPENDSNTELPDNKVPLAQYTALLTAYTKLKARVGLDIMYEKELDKEAGLV